MVANSLRVLCLDGGGVKGYTSLLILKRIFRTMVSHGTIAEEPRPCDVFDLIAGTSTGGIIAVMLGRLHMTIDECLREYEKTGEAVFGKNISSSKLGKILKAGSGSAFYDINILQERIRKVVSSRGFDAEQSFKEENTTCKVIVCVTRLSRSLPDLLRNYITVHPTQENYECAIWEAASATAAAPLYFKPVVLSKTGERFGDGGVRRNNPVNEAINETNRLKEKEWAGREIGCLVSIGTGAVEAHNLSNSIPELLKGAVAIMTDSEDIADQFIISELGQSLEKSKRYFRFNVPQGLQMLQMDEWKETEEMKASTTDYLRKYQSGNVIKTCAQSLLDPDVNLNTNTPSKPFLLPDRPCVHFVHRVDYIVQIQSFFHQFVGSSMIFVLSGMAGVGKTQIALKFAELSISSLSVFWVRADNWANFAKDYSQILRVGFSVESETQNPLDGILITTREILESRPLEWILFLDNVDDLQQFRKNIQKYIPRKGRILISTRDRRFLGGVVAANNGLHIAPMDDDEAVTLLRKSVPAELLDTANSEEHVQLIVHSVGNLPLAIAQAAANVVEHGMPIAQFSSFVYRQSTIAGTLTEPVRDFMTSDERNSVQSVTTTWTMSFDLLKRTNPSSITLLGYLACFGNGIVPYYLLKSLPEFNDMDEAEFSHNFGKLHQLCLAERINEGSNTAAQMHPLVHEIAWKTICSGNPQRWLEPTIDLICVLFPLVRHEQHSEWDTCSYFAPHALRMTQLGQQFGLMTKPFAGLMQCLSCYLNAFGEHGLSCELASAALDMATNIWGPENVNTLYVLKVKVECLESSLRNQEALQLLEDGLRYLDSDSAKLSLSTFELLKECYLLHQSMSWIMVRERNYAGKIEQEYELVRLLDKAKQTWIDRCQDTSQVPPALSEMGKFWSQLLATKDKEETRRHGHQFNIAHSLGRLGEKESSLRITESLLADFAPEGIYREGMTQFVHSMLNNKANVIREQDPSAAFDIYLTVFKESISVLGILSTDTWVAANNVVSAEHIADHTKEVAEVWRVLLDDALKPGIQLPRTSAIRDILSAMELNFWLAEDWITHLIFEDHLEEAEEFLQKLQCIHRDFARGIDVRGYYGPSISKQCIVINNRGIYFHKRGKFEDAEHYHRAAITRAEAEGDAVTSVYYYNIMLAVARQGRLEEARSYRNQNLDFISKEEDVHGTLEARMEKDQSDKATYEEAASKIERGELYNSGSWWSENKEALCCAELRYGKLEQLQQTTAGSDRVETKTQRQRKDRFGITRRLKGMSQKIVSKLPASK